MDDGAAEGRWENGDGFILDVSTPVARLCRIQAATALRRPQRITRTGNPGFLMQNHLHVNNFYFF